MPSLSEIVTACDQVTNRSSIQDFPGANNGLQIENNGEVTKIGAAVDAGIVPFEKAIEAGVDFLIVHHGLFWNTPERYTDVLYRKLKLAMDHNLAVYSSHLPLDAHQEIGNNRLLAKAIGLEPEDWFLPFEGTPIALLAKAPESRDVLKTRLQEEFKDGMTALEFGSQSPKRVAILTGSGRSALSCLRENDTDTLITGELRQEHFNLAQEERFNLYLCGHYATERYGVTALAGQMASKFQIPSHFIQTSCPL
ncbi:Nif3-like dinuclear metal center hexameric protein [Puniceicoccales bacterium CK1056]|uniref:GTP cyclohydrolase 1 type 2 homolog n=1 Tax=Oceanipulchritudo coccoides TaxID=2706888 RepID=A0A6B2M0R5_9BACT|nr:Nif3-like dinuclear metal center hexameric protein [Oceanipulchritudo coccoides]NDV62561.1 Nif3-like dinuclear metal center hexameric protein [Oceanipulchritudo coccoides]